MSGPIEPVHVDLHARFKLLFPYHEDLFTSNGTETYLRNTS